MSTRLTTLQFIRATALETAACNMFHLEPTHQNLTDWADAHEALTDAGETV